MNRIFPSLLFVVVCLTAQVGWAASGCVINASDPSGNTQTCTIVETNDTLDMPVDVLSQFAPDWVNGFFILTELPGLPNSRTDPSNWSDVIEFFSSTGKGLADTAELIPEPFQPSLANAIGTTNLPVTFVPDMFNGQYITFQVTSFSGFTDTFRILNNTAVQPPSSVPEPATAQFVMPAFALLAACYRKLKPFMP